MSDPLKDCIVTEVSRGTDTIVYVRMPSGARIVAAARNPGRARALASDEAGKVRAESRGVLAGVATPEEATAMGIIVTGEIIPLGPEHPVPEPQTLLPVVPPAGA